MFLRNYRRNFVGCPGSSMDGGETDVVAECVSRILHEMEGLDGASQFLLRPLSDGVLCLQHLSSFVQADQAEALDHSLDWHVSARSFVDFQTLDGCGPIDHANELSNAYHSGQWPYIVVFAPLGIRCPCPPTGTLAHPRFRHLTQRCRARKKRAVP